MTTPSAAATTSPTTMLLAVARALAAPNATPDAVLAAAGAQRVEPRRRRVRFAPGEARLGRGELALEPEGEGTGAIESVTFYLDTVPDPVHLEDLGRTFGDWTRVAPGTDPGSLYAVQFATTVRADRALLGRRVEVRVVATLADAPDRAGARVTEVTMLRDAQD